MSYRTFTRTFWRLNMSWPNGLEPHLGDKEYYDEYETEREAQKACHAWNAENDAGELSLKMEYEEI